MNSTVLVGLQSSCGSGPWPGKVGQSQEARAWQNGENPLKSSPHPVKPCKARTECVLLNYLAGNDLLFFDWTISWALFDLLELVDDVHTADHFTEDGVAHVEPWGRNGGDEKLAAISAGARVRHGEDAGLVEGDIACALVFKVFAPDGLATHASASWVATLDHELFDDAVKDDAIIVTVLDVCGEVFASLRCDVFEQLELNVTLGGFEDDVGHSMYDFDVKV